MRLARPPSRCPRNELKPKAFPRQQAWASADAGKGPYFMFIAHVTHEAVQKIGGIGAVLAGLITSRHYKSTVKRTVICGPLTAEDRKVIAEGRPDLKLMPAKQIEDRTAAVGLQQIEKRYGVEILHGFRRYPGLDGGVENEAEILLIDVSRVTREHVAAVKSRLQQEMGLRFDKFRLTAEHDRFIRLTVPAYEALLTLRRSKDGPCVLVAHEWMGLPLALWIVGRRDPRFRTVFHAHEVAPCRAIVEKHPGHDLMFYNAMRLATAENKSYADVFGPFDHVFTASLVAQTHRLNRIFAVGDAVVDELRFLSPELRAAPIDLVYNGIGAPKILPEAKLEAKGRLQEYARRLLGWRPDYVFTHVARPAVSKAFWRDLQVMAELDARLQAAGQRAVLFILASAAYPRSAADVARMEKEYDWPLEHRKGYPDLTGPEEAVDRYVRAFNRRAKAARAIFVNQFGWGPDVVGRRMPKTALASDIRRGSDVEFGLSIYEPFGIAQIEPLPFGTICVLSHACGCRGLLERVNKNNELVTAVIRDYASAQAGAPLSRLLRMTARQTQDIEKQMAAGLAEDVFRLLPRSDKDMKRYLAIGYRYARQMSWEIVARDMFLPGVRLTLT